MLMHKWQEGFRSSVSDTIDPTLTPAIRTAAVADTVDLSNCALTDSPAPP